MSQVAVAGLLTVLVSFLDVKNSEFVFLPAAVTLVSSGSVGFLPRFEARLVEIQHFIKKGRFN